MPCYDRAVGLLHALECLLRCVLPPQCLHWILQVDVSTFATVLELCEGGDLEGHLQQHGVSCRDEPLLSGAWCTDIVYSLHFLTEGCGTEK